MITHPFYIVDVFAETKLAGNQLAVVRHANDLSESEMQSIALEMHYSETTFILSDESRDGGFDVRILSHLEGLSVGPDSSARIAATRSPGGGFLLRLRCITPASRRTAATESADINEEAAPSALRWRTSCVVFTPTQ